MLLHVTAITSECTNECQKAQNDLLVSRDVVVVAILKLSLIMFPFGAYITNQSSFEAVRQ